jgi:hypothetical protein
MAGILPQTFFVLIGGVWADRLPHEGTVAVPNAGVPGV